jgi:hypothetical protein
MFAPPTGVAKLDQDTDNHKLASRAHAVRNFHSQDWCPLPSPTSANGSRPLDLARQLVAERRIDELFGKQMSGAAGCRAEASGSDSRQPPEIFQAIVNAIATSVTSRTRRATRLIPMRQSYRGGLGLSAYSAPILSRTLKPRADANKRNRALRHPVYGVLASATTARRHAITPAAAITQRTASIALAPSRLTTWKSAIAANRFNANHRTPLFRKSG